MPPQPTSQISILIYTLIYAWAFHVDYLLQVSSKTLYALLPSHIRATCLAHLIILDLITGLKFGELYGSLSS